MVIWETARNIDMTRPNGDLEHFPAKLFDIFGVMLVDFGVMEGKHKKSVLGCASQDA